MAVDWAWAFDTPFKWTKQIASHFGGTRQGMCVSWPKRIKDAGGIRNQFHHVIDIVPTLLEVTGIQAPDSVNGIAAEADRGREHGLHLRQGKRQRAVAAPTRNTSRCSATGLYHDGWIASTTPLRAPWDLTGPTTSDPANAFKWEL